MRKSELARKMRLQEQRDPKSYGSAVAVTTAAFLGWAFFGFECFGWLVGDDVWGAVLHATLLVIVWHLLLRLRREPSNDRRPAGRGGRHPRPARTEL